MAGTMPTDQPAGQDLLLTRPDAGPLPTRLDPAGPEARGYPADPKPGPGNSRSPGDPDGTDPRSDDLGRTT